jgi:ATP-dependent DNA helicase RecG
MLKEGRQAYFVCSLVSETENMMAQAAEDLHYRLSEHVFKEWRVEKLHGQMKPSEKEAIMERFRRHEIDVLVSTTVIEVGVDVANASVMVIEDANRFGLAQLHQLRGRVGRGVHQSFCILVADATGEDSRNRLEVMTSTNDGFEIAEADLRLRGPGVLAGTMQSGNADFLYADLLRDTVHLEQARAAAQEVVAQDPELKSMEWQRVLSRIRNQRSDIAVITVS